MKTQSLPEVILCSLLFLLQQNISNASNIKPIIAIKIIPIIAPKIGPRLL